MEFGFKSSKTTFYTAAEVVVGLFTWYCTNMTVPSYSVSTSEGDWVYFCCHLSVWVASTFTLSSNTTMIHLTHIHTRAIRTWQNTHYLLLDSLPITFWTELYLSSSSTLFPFCLSVLTADVYRHIVITDGGIDIWSSVDKGPHFLLSLIVHKAITRITYKSISTGPVPQSQLWTWKSLRS